VSRFDLKQELHKYCKKCGKNLPISLFYTSRDWKTEFYKDAWCHECVRSFVSNESTMREYCMHNRRTFQLALWELSINRAKDFFDNNPDYVNITDLAKDKSEFLSKVCRLYFQSMNRLYIYKFVENFGESNHDAPEINLSTQSPIDKSSDISLSFAYGDKTYSSIWHGFYTKGELDYLEVYYKGLERDFKLENSAYIDYAKKVCKASLAMDKAFSDILEGRIGADKRYKDFKDIFDQLSQSAKFAEKTRSENDSVGIGSFGELTKRLESTGFLQKKITFDKDTVDAIIDDFRWIISSVGEDFTNESQ